MTKNAPGPDPSTPTRRRSGPRTRRSTRPRSRRRASGAARRSFPSRSAARSSARSSCQRWKDPAGLAAHEQRLDDYLPFINDAFETMGIDTVEAQSSFLAHAAESGSFAQMTEIGASRRAPYAPVHRPRPDPGDVGGRLRAGDRLRRGDAASNSRRRPPTLESRPTPGTPEGIAPGCASSPRSPRRPRRRSRATSPRPPTRSTRSCSRPR